MLGSGESMAYTYVFQLLSAGFCLVGWPFFLPPAILSPSHYLPFLALAVPLHVWRSLLPDLSKHL